MNQKVLVAIVVIVILVLGTGGFFLLNRRGDTSKTSTNGSVTQNDNASTGMERKSLKDLLGMGGAQKCTYTDNQTSGTAYIVDQKVRTDFSSSAGGQQIGSHAIITGDKMYVWMDGQTTGYVMSTVASTPEGATDSATTTPQEGVDINKQVDYSCSNWTVDNSMFELPSGIDFQDMKAMVENVTNTMKSETTATNAPTVDCSVCDTVPAEAVAQCRTSLGCE